MSAIFQRLNSVLNHPSEFFDSIKSEKGIGNVFKYWAVISLLPIVPVYLLIFAGLSDFSSSFADYYTPVLPIHIMLTPILSYVTILFLPFVLAGLTHLSAKLLKGSGDYSASYRATIYGLTPANLFSWIPIVGFIPVLWSWAVTIKGISTLHEVSMVRAFLIVVLIPLILVVLAGASGVLFALT